MQSDEVFRSPLGPAVLSKGDWLRRLDALKRASAGRGSSADPHLAAVALLAASEAEDRLAAVEAVVRIGSPVLPLLMAALAYTPAEEANVRRAVVIALGRLGPAAREALPLLRSLAGDPWLGACVHAAIARIDSRGRVAGVVLLVAAAAVGVGVVTLLPLGRVSPVAAAAGVVGACVVLGVLWTRPGPAALAWGFVVVAAAVISVGVAGGLSDVLGRVTRALGGP
ncbi:HEAT repeat domain-containing protein [Limnoglobus roseus]|uniref:HEAT repeat domain-containing protein n=1 Tax=Limnoglobus roseus TaxID=2598579 RepID=A0A5C1AA06_9BACT|nr:HEAT repeat domain-containing protein [Limnoglobus roseus]QEL15570.1 hypothetical protein PX52LOC_02495 [Limnoglobus roseus]